MPTDGLRTARDGTIDDKARLDAVLRTMSALQSDLQSMALSAHRILTAGVVAISAGVGVIFSQNLFHEQSTAAMVALVIAVIMYFLMVVALTMHSRYSIDTLHLEALEKSANDLMGRDVLLAHQESTRGSAPWESDFFFTVVVVGIACLTNLGLLLYAALNGRTLPALAVFVVEVPLASVLLLAFSKIQASTRDRISSAYDRGRRSQVESAKTPSI